MTKKFLEPEYLRSCYAALRPVASLQISTLLRVETDSLTESDVQVLIQHLKYLQSTQFDSTIAHQILSKLGVTMNQITIF